MHDALVQGRGQEGADSNKQLDETAPQLHKRHKRNQESVTQMAIIGRSSRTDNYGHAEKRIQACARAHTLKACTPHSKYIRSQAHNQRAIFAYVHSAWAHSYKGSDLAVYAARNNPAHKMTRHYRPCDVPAGAKIVDLHRSVHACAQRPGLPRACRSS